MENRSVPRRLAPWQFALVAAAAILPYHSLPSHPLIYDATATIVNNETLREGPLSRLFVVDFWGRVPDRLSHRSYRPLTSLSYALQARTVGSSPALYHLVDLAHHALVAVLVLALLARVGILPEWALLGGLLFALHPVQTDAVCNGAGRADLLAAACLFGALWLHLGEASANSAWLRRGGALLLLAAALFCKEYAVAFPFIVILVDLARAGPADGTAERRQRRFVWAGSLVALGGYLAVRHALFGAFGAVPEGPSANPITEHPLQVRGLTSLSIVAFALRLLVLPYGLNHHYRLGTLPIVERLSDVRALAGLILVLALVAFAAFARARWREANPSLAVALLLLPLAPSLNIISVGGVLFAERFLYIPVAGLALGTVWALQRVKLQPGVLRGLRWGFAALLLCFGLLTARRVEAWSSMERLARASVDVYPESAEAWWMLGDTLAEQGRHAEAVDAIDQSIRRNPKDPRAWKVRADATSALGRHAEAAEAWHRLVELAPVKSAGLLHALGEARLRAGDAGGAVESLSRAHELAPEDLGIVEALARAYELDPGLLRRKHDLALRLIDEGRIAEAIVELQEILLVRPDHVSSLFNLARAFARAGQKEDAIEALRRGLALREDERARRFLDELQRDAAGKVGQSPGARNG